jgi:hypothetical protein
MDEQREHRMAMDVMTGVEVRGVVARNNRGEVCFFADSRADGLPLLGHDGRPMTSALAHLCRAVAESTSRRVPRADLERLDGSPSSFNQ